MSIQKSVPLLVIIFAIAVFAVAAIALISLQPASNGNLRGHISIGPICPVERNPPDPACQPTEATYAAYNLTVIGVGGQIITEFSGDANGNYYISLPAGTYVITRQSPAPIGSFMPISVRIESGMPTYQNISIDTGIR